MKKLRPDALFGLGQGRFLRCGVLILSVCSCRVSPPGRSKLWSERTADDFARLVKSGRAVAELPTTSVQTKSGGGVSIGGMQTVSVEMDEDHEAVVYAQFDARRTPGLRLNALDADAKGLLQRASSDLRIDVAEMKPVQFDAARDNQVIIAFKREISGIPVRDARINFVYGRDGAGQYHLMEIENRSFGHIKPEQRPNGSRLDETKISSVTRNKNAKISSVGDVYVVDNRQERPRLLATTWYEVTTDDGNKYSLTFSVGEEPRLIEAFSYRFDATLEASTYVRNWNGPRQYFPVPDVILEGPGGRQTLDEAGNMQDNAASGKITLRSSWAKVTSSAGHPTTFEVQSDSGRAVVKLEDDANDSTVNSTVNSTINAYVAIGRVRTFAMKFLNASDVPFFKKLLRVTTDIAETCNAYYQELSLNFYSKGNGCANMATVNDVIYHEWGHALDDYMGPGAAQYGGGITDSAFSEGVGDVVSAYMNRDSNMGVGFFTGDANRPLRRLENKSVYDPRNIAASHKQGLITGGAFWELQKRMVNKYGDAGYDKAANLFFSHLKEADSYLGSYKIIQRLADDDNNPATRHPDWCLINHAFARKGLAQEDPCQDDYATSTLGGDAKIFLALSEPIAGGATPIFVSSSIEGGYLAKLCVGKDVCSSPVTLRMNKKKSSVSFFDSTSVTVADDGYVSVGVYDQNDRELGRRVVRFIKK